MATEKRLKLGWTSIIIMTIASLFLFSNQSWKAKLFSLEDEPRQLIFMTPEHEDSRYLIPNEKHLRMLERERQTQENEDMHSNISRDNQGS